MRFARETMDMTGKHHSGCEMAKNRSRLTDSKLSDRGWRRKARPTEKDPTASLCSLERVVRPAPTERWTAEEPAWTPAGE